MPRTVLVVGDETKIRELLLFERFRRGAASEPRGSGIGLAIAAELAKAHGPASHRRQRPPVTVPTIAVLLPRR